MVVEKDLTWNSPLRRGPNDREGLFAVFTCTTRSEIYFLIYSLKVALEFTAFTPPPLLSPHVKIEYQIPQV